MPLTGLDLRRFPAALNDEGGPDAATTAWATAINAGFHEKEFTPEKLRDWAEHMVADQRVLTAVVDSSAPEGLDGAGVPVGTYAAFPGALQVGGGRELPAHLVSQVTVRPTHRRRGILRAMITEDLRLAKEAGTPVAALTASEASIYRRFGFGRSAFTRSIRVDTGPRFGLQTEPAGRVEVVATSWLQPRIPAVFAAFQASTPGSLTRQSRYEANSVGTASGETTPGLDVRSAVHLDEEGTLDGFVTYRAVGPEDDKTLEIVDLVAPGADAYLALWGYLGAVDLASAVTWDMAPVDDPLTWALRDARVVQVSHVGDLIWLRILDVAAAFSARPWTADGSVVVEVADGLGLADGRYRLTASGGSATVERTGDEAELALDVADLGSLLLGSVRPSILAKAGLARVTGEAGRMDRLFAPIATPYCISFF
ncbi:MULTISPECIES: GNAT family N-acetyltransferase [unclassified Rathayibacter]|uniref:GNAT family N-acetyltransferase n=1 Tax=unclassified Rathayibacter TaxID=2609250 RepID=UPI000CE83FE0|nr:MULTISPECIES: GNAT family N-acetyltransferase [unclassified Rathayibacter]PPH18371.1 GNAT family N-acetyltransferase [Rathayibacter sp. AY1F8]PPH35079.1 GNAT family N-acetyltransferase [Rathayibacter sp. AY1E3]PPH75103.1 GNAT family N-acetyltransferase [Rathayibacter sp. AY1D4]PPH90039.1 GNAT family N-acetyltransferase [Rathayibacter sp. AY1D3]